MTSPNLNPCRGTQVRATAEAVARHSYGKLVAFLAARSGNLAAAEDALSEAFAAALRDWPENGCPANPEAWLLTVARRKLIDMARRHRHEAPAEDYELSAVELPDLPQDSDIPDRRLGLLFACAHPAIDAAIRAPLMLQAVLGLDAARIASAFLISPATMGQRLVRAKNKIRIAGIPFRIPERAEMPERLEAVLDAIYAAFAEGWLDAAGTDAGRRDLATEAIYLGSIVAELLPEEPEALGLLALMLHAEARRKARRGPEGEYIPLAAQDVSLWDAGLIARAETALRRAAAKNTLGRYQLEAAIQSAHVDRCRTGAPNWPALLDLYDALVAITGSPVAALNRALVLSEIDGPAIGLAALEELASDPRLNEYQPWWAARAELLARAGAWQQADHAYEIAYGMERDPSMRQYLERRRAALPRP
ncbi:RNA polymerase subunit sigma-70 [Acidobacteria bacterium AB60]|nr:RNA polymerase subunit sigma-70 [Acidobacteria bacterium AB60]